MKSWAVGMAMLALARGARLMPSEDANASALVANSSAVKANSSAVATLNAVASTDRRSLKKGIILPPTSQLQCEDLKMFNNRNYGWWYSWRQAPTAGWNQSEECREDLKHSRFVPMIKNYIFLEPSELSDTYMESPYMMGYNEPYGSHDTKTGVGVMTARECVDGMKAVIAKAESGKHKMAIIAPTVNPKTSAMTWYKVFRDEAVKDGLWAKFTYISVHYYTCDAKQMMKKLKKVYKEFGLPIWLTEFNCDGNTGSSTPAMHLAYMKEVLPLLEATPYVARYSWYTLRNAKTPNANLAKGETTKKETGWVNELTELGRWYDAYLPAEDLREEPDVEREYDDDDDDREEDDDDDDREEEQDREMEDDTNVTDWFYDMFR